MTSVGRPSPAVVRPEVVQPRVYDGTRDVAWLTVLGLAASMAFADMFWVVSLRQVAGAIERTSDPFTDWVRESTLLLPTYVAAVLCVRVVRRRRVPTAAADGRPRVATALVLVGVGTLVGVLALAASSLYDYRLELTLLGHTSHGSCVVDCLDSQRTSTAVLQLKSLGLGSALILATNLVVVGWVTALLGGRLRLDRSGHPRPGHRLSGVHRRDGGTAVLASALVGAAVLHAAVVPDHASEWPVAGAFFVALACVQAGTAAAVVHHGGPVSWTTAALVSAVPLAIWLWSRTVGIPSGPDAGAVESLGVADLAAGSLELATLVLVGSWAWHRRHPLAGRPVLTLDVTLIALVALLAVTALGLGGSGLDWLDLTSGTGHVPG
ncbi:hypothetical protein ASG88_17940 [Nocardioides sp. Soil777]|uniref:hypothetical protein n=1 Tax=Nocardioides sp. Soil777 TaxID=1736409 RepID=UPI000703786F|nr:hypothetical protein [Nocardioides sp. Soil777]KRE98054.1 hypothetical protein ASG88_17940 [Nocardioides sp. Soil777]